jgi:hypothetical protein
LAVAVAATEITHTPAMAVKMVDQAVVAVLEIMADTLFLAKEIKAVEGMFLVRI